MYLRLAFPYIIFLHMAPESDSIVRHVCLPVPYSGNGKPRNHTGLSRKSKRVRANVGYSLAQPKK